MAGHSKFKNIMHRKSAQDKKRASLHGRVIKEIGVAIRLGGSDADSNPRLRLALLSARAANLGKEAIDRAIKRSSGEGSGTIYEEVHYEAFAAHGVAFIVEAATDNRNRTAAELRALFNKYGGNLGQDGSVAHGFEHQGLIFYENADAVGGMEKVFECAVEAGAQDVEPYENGCHIVTAIDDYHNVLSHLADIMGVPQMASLIWRPLNEITLSTDAVQSLDDFSAMLEDNQDVVAVFSNYRLAEEE